MKKITILTLIFIVSMLSAFAQEISIERTALKELALNTQSVQQVSSYEGGELMAQVAALPGSAYVFKSPINVQQIQYLKANGQILNKHDAFAKIQGPEVHHFHRAFEMKKVLFKQASDHFEHSKTLFKRKSLSEQAWLDISDNFYDIKMEYDELTHFFDLVLSVDEENDALVLGAPIKGLIQYSISESLDADSIIASVTPQAAIRLKVNIPINLQTIPSSFKTDSCELALDFTEQTGSGFHQTAWTQATNSQCILAVGQVLSASPIYKTNAYLINKSSVFNWEGENHIFIENNTSFQAVPVRLISSTTNTYVIQTDISLVNKSVLISSVSAVQGILMGLGL